LPIDATGAQKLKEVFARLHRVFPDLHITVEDLVAEGDKVVARNSVTGTHHGEYMGLPPTGKSVTYNEIFIFRFVEGRIAETWGVVDVFSQMKQLGVTPSEQGRGDDQVEVLPRLRALTDLGPRVGVDAAFAEDTPCRQSDVLDHRFRGALGRERSE
jgi:steroid delta-isomerase-like uncharacterized protein